RLRSLTEPRHRLRHHGGSLRIAIHAPEDLGEREPPGRIVGLHFDEAAQLIARLVERSSRDEQAREIGARLRETGIDRERRAIHLLGERTIRALLRDDPETDPGT